MSVSCWFSVQHRTIMTLKTISLQYILGVGQFRAKKVGQFEAKTLGQLAAKRVDHFERFFHAGEHSDPLETTANIMEVAGEVGHHSMKGLANLVENTSSATAGEAAQLKGVAGQVRALGSVARVAGVAATVYETVHSIGNIAQGKGTWKDWGNVAVGVATGIAMGTGVGEAAVAVVSIAYGIYKLFW